MSRNKVGLCLAFKGTNYGMLLQAYATQQIVEAYGFDTEIIDYRSGRNKGIKPSFAAMHVAITKILDKVLARKNRINTEAYDEMHIQNINKRKDSSKSFSDKYLHNIVKCNGITELKEKSKEFYAVLVGSDQLWLPDMAVTNFYTLRFAAPGVRRISYATSLGVSSYPNYAKKVAGDYWKEIDFLSVREEQGREIIQSIIDIPVEIVADPTYLLTREEWLERIPERKIVDDGYILCYFLGNTDKFVGFAKRFAKSKNLRLVSILSNECNSNDYSVFDEVLIGRGPEEFINLIRNASYVLTDSFHGLAFSVINEKQFYIFYRNRPEVKQSRHSRIDNIVKLWDVQDRLIIDPENAPVTNDIIDYEVVGRKVDSFRKESIHFIEKALLS